MGPMIHSACVESWDEEVGKGEERRMVERRREFILTAMPEQLKLTTGAAMEERARGLHKVNTYNLKANVTAQWGSLASLLPIPDFAVYAATKAGLEGFARSLARELGPRGIRVNAVAPPYSETEMTSYRSSFDGMIEVWLRDTPMHRMGQPNEIASVVHFLASDASSLMTGTTVVADAGFTCW